MALVHKEPVKNQLIAALNPLLAKDTVYPHLANYMTILHTQATLTYLTAFLHVWQIFSLYPQQIPQDESGKSLQLFARECAKKIGKIKPAKVRTALEALEQDINPSSRVGYRNK